jgi:Holliday junction resolvase-like predicted endonuclease
MMHIQREIILSVLRLAKNGPVQKDLIAKDAHVSTAVADELLRTLQEKGLIQLKGRFLEIAPNQKLQLAIETIKQGADPERACRFLEWKEFENMAATAFEINNYTVKRNLHFKASGKRWEIDLLAFKQPLIACVDCKHWQHGWSRASIIKVVETQVERTQALAGSLQTFADKLGIDKWLKATLIPIVLSLVPSQFKLHNDTPIVSILQLQSFINELPAQTIFLTRFSTIIKERSAKLTEF